MGSFLQLYSVHTVVRLVSSMDSRQNLGERRRSTILTSTNVSAERRCDEEGTVSEFVSL